MKELKQKLLQIKKIDGLNSAIHVTPTCGSIILATCKLHPVLM